MNRYSQVTCLPYSQKQELPSTGVMCMVEQCSCSGGATVGGCFPYPDGMCHRLYAGPLPEAGPNVGYTPMFDLTACDNNAYSEDQPVPFEP
jgi:hypothetical protein